VPGRIDPSETGGAEKKRRNNPTENGKTAPKKAGPPRRGGFCKGKGEGGSDGTRQLIKIEKAPVQLKGGGIVQKYGELILRKAVGGRKRGKNQAHDRCCWVGLGGLPEIKRKTTRKEKGPDKSTIRRGRGKASGECMEKECKGTEKKGANSLKKKIGRGSGLVAPFGGGGGGT